MHPVTDIPVTDDSRPVAILAERLGIPGEFLERYDQVIQKKLREAAQRLRDRPDGDDGIKQLLHLASSVVLRQEPADLDSALRRASELIRELPGLTGWDPETVLTIAAVHFLLERGREADSSDGDLRLLWRTLDARHWLIGKAAMTALGIEPAD